MKKRILYLAAGILLTACGQPAREAGYTIDGELAGVTGKVYLTVFEGKMPHRIDSTEIVNGTFTFTGDRPLPILSAIETGDGPLVRFFLENSPISVRGSAAAPQQIAVEGSATNDLYQSYIAETVPVKAMLESDSVKLSGTMVRDSLENVLSGIGHAFVRSHPGSVAAAYVLYRDLSYDMPYEALNGALAAFDPAVRESVYAKLVETMAGALEKTSAGKPFTDVSAPDTSGRTVALSELVGDGKYVLLDFWASWCPPCRAELPHLAAARKQYGPKGFEIYAVSLDKTRDAWVRAIRNMKLDWTHVSALKFWESPAADAYGVRSIPSNVLIGPDGTIIERNLMGEKLLQKLSELLDKPVASEAPAGTPAVSEP